MKRGGLISRIGKHEYFTTRPLRKYYLILILNIIQRSCNTSNIEVYILKNVLRGGEKVLEIGTGHTALMSLIAEKVFKCDVTATELDNEFYSYAKLNIARNNSRIKLLKSSGGIIRGVVPRGERFDVIFSAPPYYEKHSGGVLTEREALGGGKFGEEFSIKLLNEALDYLNAGGKVALFLPHKRDLLNAIKMKGIRLGYEVRDILFKVGTRKRHSLILTV